MISNIITTAIEIAVIALFIYGLRKEDKLVEWEQRQLRTIRLKLSWFKFKSKIRWRRIKMLICQDVMAKVVDWAFRKEMESGRPLQLSGWKND